MKKPRKEKKCDICRTKMIRKKELIDVWTCPKCDANEDHIDSVLPDEVCKVCKWKEVRDFEEDSYYSTSCNNTIIMLEDTPEKNGYKYCPFCRKKIVCEYIEKLSCT
jgi:hypothetical protein